MRPLHVAMVVGAVLLALGGLAYMMSGGALLSEGHHEWRVVVEPQGEGAWALYVPRIVADDETGMGALDAMLSTLEVSEGKAGFALDHMRMRLDGEGRAVLVARSEFGGMGPVGEREAFSRWRVPNMTVMQEEGPALRVVWAVDFSGGEGHTCWARAELAADVTTGASAELREAGEVVVTAPPGGGASRPWGVVCA